MRVLVYFFFLTTSLSLLAMEGENVSVPVLDYTISREINSADWSTKHLNIEIDMCAAKKPSDVFFVQCVPAGDDFFVILHSKNKDVVRQIVLHDFPMSLSVSPYADVFIAIFQIPLTTWEEALLGVRNLMNLFEQNKLLSSSLIADMSQEIQYYFFASAEDFESLRSDFFNASTASPTDEDSECESDYESSSDECSGNVNTINAGDVDDFPSKLDLPGRVAKDGDIRISMKQSSLNWLHDVEQSENNTK